MFVLLVHVYISLDTQFGFYVFALLCSPTGLSSQATGNSSRNAQDHHCHLFRLRIHILHFCCFVEFELIDTVRIGCHCSVTSDDRLHIGFWISLTMFLTSAQRRIARPGPASSFMLRQYTIMCLICRWTVSREDVETSGTSLTRLGLLNHVHYIVVLLVTSRCKDMMLVTTHSASVHVVLKGTINRTRIPRWSMSTRSLSLVCYLSR